MEQQTVLQLFDHVVRQKPANTAVVHEQRELSYEELDRLAMRFANALERRGVKSGDRVGLCIDRCPEAVAAMLGVFKAGAVFVPLDPEYPIDRIRFMIEDAGIQCVITHNKSDNDLATQIDGELSLVWIDSATREFSQLGGTVGLNSKKAPTAEDLAYIMYTSGSTGNPKGVQIEHRALTTYCLADIEVYRLSESDRTLQFSTLNFDIAIEEIFPPLLIGSCVVVRPVERSDDVIELSSIIEQYSVTAVHLATAYWHEWVDLMQAAGRRVPESLRLAIATGEKVSVEHYRRWLKLCDHEVLWCNAYGPTEATVSATVFVPDENFDEDNMPIGRALPGYGTHILTDDLRPIGEGETGQLYLAGPALARGYLNREDLTQKAFVDVDLEEIGLTRLYRTGDLARWREDGNIEFAGRIDHQIKLGSYRIEPGEIEVAIHKHPAVLESLVLYEQVDAQKYLVAYVAIGSNQVSISDLSGFLSQQLPVYMVPARYCLLPSFPKTINGKIDRRALPPASESITAYSDTYVEPRDEIEKRLATLWSDVLQIPRIGIHDDFFSLGGSSLLVTRVVTALTAQWDIELPVRDFFANPTIASASRHLKRLIAASAGEALDETEPIDEQELRREQQQRRDRLPLVDAAFIVNGERELFSVRYLPRLSDPRWTASRKHGVVLCHPLGHEYTRAYRNLQQLSLLLCSAGFDVLRFDYYGTGNSSGQCDDYRVESLQADLRHAVDYFSSKADVQRISLLGIRIGATIAATTKLDDYIGNRILWDPIVDGRNFVNLLDDLQSHVLGTQTRFHQMVQAPKDELFGHRWSGEKRSSFCHLRLPESMSHCGHAAVILSRGYADKEHGISQLPDSYTVRQTEDEIYWHRPEFTESAFASPEAFRAILETLEADGSATVGTRMQASREAMESCEGTQGVGRIDENGNLKKGDVVCAN